MRSTSSARRSSATDPIRRAGISLELPRVTVLLETLDWFRTLPVGTRLPPGKRAPDMLRVPEASANAVLRGVLHLVADIGPKQPPTVVWVDGSDELLVLLDRTALHCATGFITVSLVVQCDEVTKEQRVDLTFAVGSPEQPAGLLMSTFDRVAGPAVITETWTPALTAFAWEALITLAQQLAGAVGKDSEGRPLVPGAIASDKGTLLLSPMARNSLNLLDDA